MDDRNTEFRLFRDILLSPTNPGDLSEQKTCTIYHKWGARAYHNADEAGKKFSPCLYVFLTQLWFLDICRLNIGTLCFARRPP